MKRELLPYANKLAPLSYFEKARRAVAKARSMNEVMKIRIEAVALAAAAKVAKDRSMEADAIAMRLIATRRLDQFRQVQKATVGLARGGEHGGRRKKDGVRKAPSIVRPTLAMQGIDKHLAKQARTLGSLSEQQFEAVVDDARAKANRGVRNAVREVEIEIEREAYRARTYQGGTIADLEALIGKIYFGVIAVDWPWIFEAWSHKGKQRSAERRYETWPIERILEFAPIIGKLAALDAALFQWIVWPQPPSINERVIKASGFDYATLGFNWIKTERDATSIGLDGTGLHLGQGKSGTRSNSEVCLQATRGAPLRLAADVEQVVIAPVGEHSEKPDEVYRRIEQLFPGPYLELFARKEREHWTTWGNEIRRSEAAE